jgi:hypothetical protein
MPVPGAISNVCAVTYRVRGLPAPDVLKMAKDVRFGERIQSETSLIYEEAVWLIIKQEREIRQERSPKNGPIRRIKPQHS